MTQALGPANTVLLSCCLTIDINLLILMNSVVFQPGSTIFILIILSFSRVHLIQKKELCLHKWEHFKFQPTALMITPLGSTVMTDTGNSNNLNIFISTISSYADTSACSDMLIITRYSCSDGASRRKNATRETTSTLKAWLQEHQKNPYPTKGEKIMLAIITRMTLTQVQTSPHPPPQNKSKETVARLSNELNRIIQ